jgi:hypothetical protein
VLRVHGYEPIRRRYLIPQGLIYLINYHLFLSLASTRDILHPQGTTLEPACVQQVTMVEMSLFCNEQPAAVPEKFSGAKQKGPDRDYIDSSASYDLITFSCLFYNQCVRCRKHRQRCSGPTGEGPSPTEKGSCKQTFKTG